MLFAFLSLANRRENREMAKDLSIGVAASRGDIKVVKKQVKKWASER